MCVCVYHNVFAIRSPFFPSDTIVSLIVLADLIPRSFLWWAIKMASILRIFVLSLITIRPSYPKVMIWSRSTYTSIFFNWCIVGNASVRTRSLKSHWNVTFVYCTFVRFENIIYIFLFFLFFLQQISPRYLYLHSMQLFGQIWYTYNIYVSSWTIL